MITAIIVAAGQGRRMKNKKNKLFLPLKKRPLLAWTLSSTALSNVDNIIVVAQAKDLNKVKDLVNKFSLKKVIAIIEGGEERQDSVANALEFLPKDCKTVAIHDGARPLATSEFINSLLGSIENFDGVIPALMPVDTIKEVRGGKVKKTLHRQNLRTIQTPQVFCKKSLVVSYKKAKEEAFYGTDDASLLERYGYEVKVVEGSCDNIKITTPVDLALAEVLLSDTVNG